MDDIYIHSLLDTLMEVSEEGIISIDKDEKITYINAAAIRLLGIDSKDKYIGSNICKLIKDNELPNVMRTGEIERGTVFRKNDRELISNRTPILYKGKVLGALEIFTDITDFKRMDRALTQERQHSKVLEVMFKTAYDWIVLVDTDGIITMMSQAYLDFLELEKEEAIGKHVTEVIPNTRMHIVVKTGESEINDIQEIKGNHMIATRLPIIVDGKVIGAVGKVNFKDISDFNNTAKKVSNMEKELEYYRDELKKAREGKYSFKSIVGLSPELTRLKDVSRKVAKGDSNVLILGESGTGKELFAHGIHNHSYRCDGPFIKVNCAAIPTDLLESELFGYEEGAFTGAKKGGKIGKFELANKGSIFLDEIGDMDIKMQAKLLRVLQEKEIEKVGGSSTIKVDVRIIAATNKKLDELVEKGEFREDLYYRLNVVTLNLPPLRERVEDIKPLSKHLLDKLSHNMGIVVSDISNEAMKYLMNYDWPGNIRELENALERALNLLDKETVVGVNHLPAKIIENSKYIWHELDDYKKAMAKLEKEMIFNCLRSVDGNKKEAAKKLNMSRTTLYEKLKKFSD